MTTIDLTAYNALFDDAGDNLSGTLATKANILLNPILTPVQAAVTALDAAIANIGALRASASNSVVQAVVTATFTAILFDTEAYDTAGIHSTASQTSRFTVPAGAGGLWLVTGMLTWAGSSAGTQRQGLIYKNGAAVVTNVVAPSVAYEPQNPVTALLTLAATDYVELYGYQDAGVNLNTVAAKTLLSVVKIG